MINTVLVDVAGDRDQIGKHRVTDGSGDFGVGQCIQADVDDATLANDLQPIEDRPRIIEVGVIWGE
ncbi:hypothetical protein D3C84_1225680 [compost metagenome]